MTNIFICNAGSSSLKFSLVEAGHERVLAEGGVDWSGEPARLSIKLDGNQRPAKLMTLRNHTDALTGILDQLHSEASENPGAGFEIHAVGHRIVHGGDQYTSAVVVTAEVKRVIAELSRLAPLHNPANLEGINAMERAVPGVPQVAAFDTAFHATLPEAVRTYPVPRQWTEQWGVRRYGFHGLSHAYCAARAAELLGRSDARLIILHLGGGASVSAVNRGVCVDTSMGFTPLDGLMMGTRSGSVDPGMLIHLMRTQRLDADRLDRALNYESGLLGVSGVSSDMRQVLTAAEHNPSARLAIDIYVHRVRQTIGAMTATLGGVDGLVFTAGVGEHSPEIRRRVCENLQGLGLTLDPAANASCRPDVDIADPASPSRILVITSREDLSIVRETRRLIAPAEA